MHENFGEIESFEKTPNGVRMNYQKDGDRNSAEASLAVVAVGWQANTAELNLRPQVLRSMIEDLCSSIHTCERPRRTFLPREISPVDCCSFLQRFRTVSWQRRTRSAARR